MSREIDLVLPLDVYRVGGTCFSTSQVAAMVDRTNRKLFANDTGIKIEVQNETSIPDPDKSLAYVSDGNVEQLLQHGVAQNKNVRLFLVKAEVSDRIGSWTYDPIPTGNDPAIWSGAIFITELYNDNDDNCYISLGFEPTNDSLLHELGHVLMKEGTHFEDPADPTKKNFFHKEAKYTNDEILPSQVARMRNEASIPPFYLTPIRE